MLDVLWYDLESAGEFKNFPRIFFKNFVDAQFEFVFFWLLSILNLNKAVEKGVRVISQWTTDKKYMER